MNGVTDHLAKFAVAMRQNGIHSSLSDEIDAAGALLLVDVADRLEVQRALRIAFKVQRDGWTTFDRLFDEYWGGKVVPEVPIPPAADHWESRRALQWRWDGVRVRLETPEPEASDSSDPAYSWDRLLRRKTFDRISQSEVASMERLLARLALKFAAKRSRRLEPTSGRGVVDLRRSFRNGLAGQGDLLSLARRARAREEPRVVLLYDTSGSMDPYTGFHLAFAFALRRVIRRLEIFAFNTALVRVSRVVSPAKVLQSLKRLATEVPDWSGGTRIGACLAEFVTEYRGLVDRDTTVVIVSDGLDLGDTDLLAGSMRALRQRARMTVWLNPLKGDSRYEPSAAGMRAALPHIDHFGAGHDLASLERLTRLLN
ncbi:MAG TPA: VWA domain-containing protein [Casimicrobiaceae bacterium]|nr:VWA domain-containing protein [Casimicrobiaceae bacterium]